MASLAVQAAAISAVNDGIVKCGQIWKANSDGRLREISSCDSDSVQTVPTLKNLNYIYEGRASTIKTANLLANYTMIFDPAPSSAPVPAGFTARLEELRAFMKTVPVLGGDYEGHDGFLTKRSKPLLGFALLAVRLAEIAPDAALSQTTDFRTSWMTPTEWWVEASGFIIRGTIEPAQTVELRQRCYRWQAHELAEVLRKRFDAQPKRIKEIAAELLGGDHSFVAALG